MTTPVVKFVSMEGSICVIIDAPLIGTPWKFLQVGQL
jgi:hypothetical protein